MIAPTNECQSAIIKEGLNLVGEIMSVFAGFITFACAIQ